MTRTIGAHGYETVDIMIDHDDVVQPWFAPVDEECVRHWGESPKGPCSVWSMWEHYDRTQQEWGLVVESAIQTGLYHTVDPMPGAVEAINRLRWFGHRVHIVTARGFMKNSENIRAWTPAYYERFGIGYDTLTFAKDKVAAQEELGLLYDYAIDDGGHNYTALWEAGVNVWLCKAPHNANVPAERRIDSLWEFSQMILEETVPEHMLGFVEASA